MMVDFVIALFLAVEISIVIDIIHTYVICVPIGKKRIILYLVLCCSFAAVISFISSSVALCLLVLFSFVLLAVLIFITAVFVSFRNKSSCRAFDELRSNVWAEKRIMIIVPHEDDELNLCGGILDEFIEYGSDVYIVFVTNGDYKGQANERIHETIDCWTRKGLNEDHLIFLGYGDGWNEKFPHIYNAQADEVIESLAGKRQTYGTENHPAYNDGNTYTYRHIFEDLYSVIMSIKPDTIFASDYDNHPDHRAVSLLFEKVMGSILKTNLNYKPYVFKGYAYKTAWEAFDDFYSINLKSTKDKYDELCFSFYDWNKRVRFPITEKSIDKSILSTSLYNDLSAYKSQFADCLADRIINGDKVFWQRRTDSLLYEADVQVSSGNKDCLTGFNILDSTDVRDKFLIPTASVWCPDVSDKNKTITIRFKEEKDIYCIALYESISPKDNIKNILIRFDDGTSLDTGELNHDGSSTVIVIDKKGVIFFSLSITDFEGEKAGLAQLEAFETCAQQYPEFIKVIDRNDDFVYDYIIESETTRFWLYSNAKIPSLNAKSFSVYIDNPKCRCHIKDDYIEVYCPKGQRCSLTVSYDHTGLTDTVWLHNAGLVKKKSIGLFQIIDKNRFLGYKLQLWVEPIRIAKRFYKGLEKRIWSKHE